MLLAKIESNEDLASRKIKKAKRRSKDEDDKMQIQINMDIQDDMYDPDNLYRVRLLDKLQKSHQN
jgi:hypothetical protein